MSYTYYIQNYETIKMVATKDTVEEHMARKRMLREYYKKIQSNKTRSVQEIYHKLLHENEGLDTTEESN